MDILELAGRHAVLALADPGRRSFAGIEILAPGVFFIWLGAAAAVTGVIALVIPGLGWEIEALLFALLAAPSIVGWRSYQKKTAKNEVPSTLNRRGEQMIGRTAVLSEPIQNGRGKAKIDNSVWQSKAATCLPVRRSR